MNAMPMNVHIKGAGMIKWFKKLFCIVKYYNVERDLMNKSINEARENAIEAHAISIAAREFIKRNTQLHADISPYRRDGNFIILIGRYKNNDYVEIIPLKSDAFKELVKECRYYAELSRSGHIDSPQPMREAIKRDLFND